MAQIVTITNPITGQPVQVDQLDHTAQQIDDAISRALPGGAIDQRVSMLPGQNLLDNSVFVDGCLVDQRQGYVVPPGVPCSGEPSGVTTKYYTVKGTYIYNDVKYALFDVGDSEYNAPFYTCVRGYTGAGYGIDRWFNHSDGTSLLIDSDGITLVKKEPNPECGFYQKLPIITTEQVKVTASVLFKGVATITHWGKSAFDGVSKVSSDWDVLTYTYTIPANTDLSVAWFPWFGFTNASGLTSTKFKAAFLDIGDHQTLAHQDANGVWQLNALPNYADTLARCQRFFQRLDIRESGTKNEYGAYNAQLRFQVPMRTPPAVSFTKTDGGFDVVCNVTTNQVASISFINGSTSDYWYGYADLTADL